MRGCEFTSLPVSVPFLTNLSKLYLKSNNIDSLSESIGDLINLKVLDLSGNQLTGLPESIGNLINLEILDLDENPLTSLPESISELTNLKIDLDENQLEIPMIKKKYDENLDLSDKHERIKKHSQNITSRLSPTSKTQLTRRRNIALSQGTNPLLDPLGYFNRYQDTMRSIELTENKLSKPDSGVVVAITAICLCHGKIKGDINTHINTASTRSNRDTLPTVSRPSVIIKIPQTNSSEQVIKYDYTVTYGKNPKKFEFTYSTIPYCGVFTNVGSCSGLPTFDRPNSFFNEQNIVTHEYKLLTCDETTSPEKCQPYILSLDIDPKISIKLKEKSVSEIEESEIEESEIEESERLFLSMHDDYLCQSLMNKLYEAKHSELLTKDSFITRGDSGKFILLTKIKHIRDGREDFEIVKTVILGSNNFQEELELLGRKTNKDMSEFIEMVDVIEGVIDTYYTTTTEKVVGLINHLKDGDIPVRFFDSSCNMYSDIDYENPTPSHLLEIEILNKYFLKEATTGHAVYGGKKRTRRVKRIR